MSKKRHSRGTAKGKGGQFASADRAQDVSLDAGLMSLSQVRYSDDNPLDEAAYEEAQIALMNHYLQEYTVRMERARDACEGKRRDSPERREAVMRWVELLEAYRDMYRAGYHEIASARVKSLLQDHSNRWLCTYNLKRVISHERYARLATPIEDMLYEQALML